MVDETRAEHVAHEDRVGDRRAVRGDAGRSDSHLQRRTCTGTRESARHVGRDFEESETAVHGEVATHVHVADLDERADPGEKETVEWSGRIRRVVAGIDGFDVVGHDQAQRDAGFDVAQRVLRRCGGAGGEPRDAGGRDEAVAGVDRGVALDGAGDGELERERERLGRLVVVEVRGAAGVRDEPGGGELGEQILDRRGAWQDRQRAGSVVRCESDFGIEGSTCTDRELDVLRWRNADGRGARPACVCTTHLPLGSTVDRGVRAAVDGLARFERNQAAGRDPRNATRTVRVRADFGSAHDLTGRPRLDVVDERLDRLEHPVEVRGVGDAEVAGDEDAVGQERQLHVAGEHRGAVARHELGERGDRRVGADVRQQIDRVRTGRAEVDLGRRVGEEVRVGDLQLSAELGAEDVGGQREVDVDVGDTVVGEVELHQILDGEGGELVDGDAVEAIRIGQPERNREVHVEVSLRLGVGETELDRDGRTGRQ